MYISRAMNNDPVFCRRTTALRLLQILLECAHELVLFLCGLEPSVTHVAGRVDELELNLLQGAAGGVGDEGLSEGQDTLLGTNASALNHDKVLVHNAVMREAAQRSDGLLRDVILCGSVALVITLTNAVDLLVDFCSVMITTLTGTGDRVHDTARMPSTDTSDLAKTLVRLSRQLLGAVTMCDALKTVTFCDANNVNHLILLENTGDVNCLLKVFFGPDDLVG